LHVLRLVPPRGPIRTYSLYEVLDAHGSVAMSMKTYHSQGAWMPDSRHWVAFHDAGNGAHIIVSDTVDSHVKSYKILTSVGNALLGCTRDGHVLTADYRKLQYPA